MKEEKKSPQLITDDERLNSVNTYRSLYLQYAKMVRLRQKDLNARDSRSGVNSHKQFSRESILSYLKSPQQNSANLIDASIYLSTTSLLYQRVLGYWSAMSSFDYVLSPYKLRDYDTSEGAKKKYLNAYSKSSEKVDGINIKHTFGNILKVVLREGAFFGVEIENKDSHMIYRFPHNKCKVTSMEDGCPMYELDLSFFDDHPLLLDGIGGGFKTAHSTYEGGGAQWYEVPSDIAACFLADETIDYIIPPLVGCFPDLYLLDNLKDLVETKEIQDLYKLLSLKYPMDEDGQLQMDDELARSFFNDIADQLPDQIGAVLNPFAVTPITFEKSAIDRDATARAERDLFSSLGISSMLFNNNKATSTALSYSITNDYSFILPNIRSFERWLNKKLKMMSGSIKFKITILDVNNYNRQQFADSLRKDMMYGLPIKSVLASVNTGLLQSDVYGLTYLENEVLGITDKLVVPNSANTTSTTDEGRPESEELLSDAGEITRDTDANDDR